MGNKSLQQSTKIALFQNVIVVIQGIEIKHVITDQKIKNSKHKFRLNSMYLQELLKASSKCHIFNTIFDENANSC